MVISMARKLRTAATAAVLGIALFSVAAATAGAQELTPANPAPPTPPTAPAPPPASDAPTEPVPGNVADPVEALTKPGDRAMLSDELSITRWSHPQDQSKIRSLPSVSAPAIGRLRFLTEDGLAEVYIALDARVDAAKRAWLRIRLPGRPNGRTGWVRREALGDLLVVRTRLVIVRTALRATLYKSNTPIWSARVGIGKAGTPTPLGVFYIRERLRGSGGTYGPWAFGTSAYSALSDWPGGGVVGIHGTNQPGLIPGRPSHGCVRMRNDKIRRLARLMPIGTPVHIVR
jgi:hypothetical protein